MHNKSRRRVVASVVFSVCLLAGMILAAWTMGEPENAAMDLSSRPEGDSVAFERRIEIIAVSCASCHGTDGMLRTAIPSLAGRPASVLQAQLRAFREDQMPGATLMPRIAPAFTDEEIKGLAEYFSALAP